VCFLLFNTLESSNALFFNLWSANINLYRFADTLDDLDASTELEKLHSQKLNSGNVGYHSGHNLVFPSPI